MALNRELAVLADGGTRDPVILLAVTVLLIVVAGIACTAPARRASKLEPISALRHE